MVIEKVRPQSRAYQRGFEPGDVVLQINDHPVRDPQTFRKAMARALGRDSILLLIQRGNFRYYVTLELS